MENKFEAVKTRAGNPFTVIEAIRRAAAGGMEALSEDELGLCKWYGLYPHRHERDFFMLRITLPNGFLNPKQLREIAKIAETQNRGFADISTRQSLQLHWCHAKDAAGILERLGQVGISTMGACGDVLRNLVGCPVAGVDRDEILDASPIVQQVYRHFVGKPEFANLPRKYKMGITGCRVWCSHPEINCVSLTGAERAVDGKREAGFDLRLGGGLSTQPFFSQRLGRFVTPDQVLPVLTAITEIYRDSAEYREKRHRARFKFLIKDVGVETFRDTLEQRLGFRLDDAPAEYQEPEDVFRDHVGVHAQQQDGLFYIGLPVLVGRISAKQMQKVAHVAETYADGTIRATSRQNIMLLNVPEANVERALESLGEANLNINAHALRRSMVTCTGTEFCRLAITETKARSREIVEYLESRLNIEEPIRLHLTGCPNACAQYQIANIGLMGSKTKVDGQIVDAYDILVGGQVGRGMAFNHPVLRKVPATDVKRRLERLLAAFKAKRKGAESFNAFCARLGDAQVAELLSDPEDASDGSDVVVPAVPDSDGPIP